VYFTNVVVKALGAAQTSVLVQAYTFTSASIARALLDAHHRGVKVEVVLDKSQRSAQYSGADLLARADIPVKIDSGG
jgi:phosphatidylserine/phosphatidylglycerophosphate/cardiolipin synthase-like enzyme